MRRHPAAGRRPGQQA